MNVFASVFAFLILIVPNSLLVFDLKCSHRSHWIQRAKNICERHEFYHCLHDNNTKSSREKCFKPDDLTPGYHGVISGQLHVEPCEDSQFSPHKSWSNDGYECLYKKSKCSEEGQIVVDNGSNTRDVKCRCDYRNGYAYTIKPKNECMCSPSVEDCSCHLVYCQDDISFLSQDYVCLTQEKKATVMKCQAIENKRKSDSNEDMKSATSVTSFTDLNPRKFHLECGVLVVVFLIGICCICLLGYMPLERKSEEERILQNVTKLSLFSVLRHTMKKASLLVLTGRQGTGKTTVAKCLHGHFPEKRCIIIRIKKAELNYNSSQVSYMIVDASEKVTAFDQSIRTYLKNIKATKLIIVVEDIPPNLTTILKEFANQTDVIFNLDDKDFYNNRDKENILKLHMKSNHIYFEDEVTQLQSLEDSKAVCIAKSLFDDLLSEETLLGFPKMCASLCSHRDHIRQGIQYFRQPPALLITEIDDLREKGESDEISAIQYCLLVSALLCPNNNMSLTDCDLQASITMNMKLFFPGKRVSFDLHMVKTIIFHLMPRYFESNESELAFSHPIIYQAVLITYCNTHSEPIFGKCSMRDIIFLLRPPNYQPLHDEMVLTVDYRQSGFVSLVINTLVFGSSKADNIIKQIRRYTEYHKDTQFIQLIINHVKSVQTYTHQFRLRFFRDISEFDARLFKSIFKIELEAYCSAWRYVCVKKEGNEDELKLYTGKDFTCESEVIGKILHTLVDEFGNTLLHYFVIWNGNAENNIINTILKNKDEHGIADFWKSSNLENAKKHTPLHFAVYFGRQDFIDKFITMKEIAHSKETWFHSLYENVRKLFSNEKENLKCILESGMNHILEDIKSDRDINILFEIELITSLSAIKFGKTEEFDHIMSILQNKI